MTSTFTNLTAWKKAHTLVLEVYRLSATFPSSEIYGLSSQIRRAAVSITSNIAEGYGRHNAKEKLQFFYISLGSLAEVENQIIIAKDLNYITESDLTNFAANATEVGKILTGLLNSYK